MADIKIGNSENALDAVGGLKVNGTTIVTSAGAVTADIQATAGSISRTELSAAAGSKTQMANSPTITTTGNTDVYVIVPESGTVTSIDFSGVDALAANDTNYITYTVTNLGQSGAGSTAILQAIDINTTKATGGAALAANTKRSLTLSSTPANLAVVQGDRLRIRAAATGTLANTVTFPGYMIRYSGTT